MKALKASDQVGVDIEVRVNESEPTVKASAFASSSIDSDSVTSNGDKPPRMQAERQDQDEVISAYVRHRIEEWIAEGDRPGHDPEDVRNQKTLAAASKVPASAISQIRRELIGVGGIVARRFATHFKFRSVEELRLAAYEWYRREHDSVPPQPEVHHDPRYERLERVLKRATELRRAWSLSAIAAARTHQLDADEDPSEAWWVETLDRLDAVLKVSIPKVPDRGADPLDGLNDSPTVTARAKRAQRKE